MKLCLVIMKSLMYKGIRIEIIVYLCTPEVRNFNWVYMFNLVYLFSIVSRVIICISIILSGFGNLSTRMRSHGENRVERHETINWAEGIRTNCGEYNSTACPHKEGGKMALALHCRLQELRAGNVNAKAWPSSAKVIIDDGRSVSTNKPKWRPT